MIMKKQILLILAVLLLALSTLACSLSFNDFGFNTARGSGVLVTKERPVSGFQNVELTGIGTLVIEVGSEEALVIEDGFIQDGESASGSRQNEPFGIRVCQPSSYSGFNR